MVKQSLTSFRFETSTARTRSLPISVQMPIRASDAPPTKLSLRRTEKQTQLSQCHRPTPHTPFLPTTKLRRKRLVSSHLPPPIRPHPPPLSSYCHAHTKLTLHFSTVESQQASPPARPQPQSASTPAPPKVRPPCPAVWAAAHATPPPRAPTSSGPNSWRSSAARRNALGGAGWR